MESLYAHANPLLSVASPHFNLWGMLGQSPTTFYRNQAQVCNLKTGSGQGSENLQQDERERDNEV